MPSTTISNTSKQKAALRREIRTKAEALTPEALARSDRVLFFRFLSLPEVQAAGAILLYLGMGTEPDTAQLIPPLLAAGKTIALPRCLPGNQLEARRITGSSRLVRHPYGMWEPGTDCQVLPKERLDLILTPGLAFDRQCRRLGRGGGFYDRYLADSAGFTTALCRDCFLLEEIPCQSHDRRVDCVCAECGVFSAPAENGAGPAGPAPRGDGR